MNEGLVFSNNFIVDDSDIHIEGPFELHIVFDPRDEPLYFQFFLSNLEKRYGIINPKTTGFCALYGKHPLHIMLSCYMREKTTQFAMATAKQIASDMMDAGIRILRTKMESSLNSSGVPDHCSGHIKYYEIHIKVQVNSMDVWNELVKLVKPYGAHLFQNNRSKAKGIHAIVTMRQYNTTSISANKLFYEVSSLVEKTFAVSSIRAEYGFYDSNPMLDQDWMFDGNDPTNIKK